METQDIHHIYRDGRHYDRLYDGIPPMSFWIELAQEAGGAILELGCGTGKIAIPLAEAGFDVVGLDMAKSMLREAKKKDRAQ